MKIEVSGHICCKQSESLSDCADRYEIETAFHKFAISDGVTRSFFPNYWAKNLVASFVNSEDNDYDEARIISIAQKKWLGEIEKTMQKPGIPWYTKNAFASKKAGLATFVGLQILPKISKWKVNARGDSYLFFVPHDYKNLFDDCKVVPPLPDSNRFSNYPDFYCSYGSSHGGIGHSYEGTIENGTFYMMTDALAEWFVNQKETALSKMDGISNQLEFETLVKKERAKERLKDDDCSLLKIKLSEADKNKLISYRRIDLSEIDVLIQNEELKNSDIPIHSDLTNNTESSYTSNKSKFSKNNNLSQDDIVDTEPMDSTGDNEKINATEPDLENHSEYSSDLSKDNDQHIHDDFLKENKYNSNQNLEVFGNKSKNQPKIIINEKPFEITRAELNVEHVKKSDDNPANSYQDYHQVDYESYDDNYFRPVIASEDGNDNHATIREVISNDSINLDESNINILDTADPTHSVDGRNHTNSTVDIKNPQKKNTEIKEKKSSNIANIINSIRTIFKK